MKYLQIETLLNQIQTAHPKSAPAVAELRKLTIPEYVSQDEFAELIGVKRVAVYRRVKAGKLIAHLRDGKLMYRYDDYREQRKLNRNGRKS